MLKHIKQFNLDTIIKYGIAAILIAVPLYPKFPFLNVPGIYVSIRIEDFLILAVSILWFINNISTILKLFENRLIRVIVLFLLTTLLATLSGILFLRTATSLIGLLEWARRVEYLIGFVIAFTSIKSIKDVEFYIKCIGIVLVIVFIFGVGQKYFNFPVITTQNSEYSKGIALRYLSGTQLVSTFAGHYDLAGYVLLTSPIFVSMLFMKKISLKVKGIIFVVIAMSFWLMVNAASRTTTLSYVLAVSIALIILRKYKYVPIVVVITTIFAFSTSNLFDRYLNIINVIKSKLMGLMPTAYAQDIGPTPTPAPPAPYVQDLSTAIRLNVEWPRAIRAFLKNPLLGTGYSSTTLATDNDYLRSLAETGLLGFVSLFFVFFRMLQELTVRSWPKGLFSKKEIDFRAVFLAGIIGAIPGILLNAVFIDIFEASKFAIPFWILAGFAIALVTRNVYE